MSGYLHGKDFEKVRVKDYVQKVYYWLPYLKHGMLSNVLSIAGPDITRHIKDARNGTARTPTSRVTILEISKNIHNRQKRKFEHLTGHWTATDNSRLPLTHKVQLTHGDLEFAKPERFIDADLMGTHTTCGQELLKPLKKQANMRGQQKTLLKAFIFTLTAARTTNEKETLKWIKEKLLPAIGCKVASFGRKTKITERVRDITQPRGGSYLHKFRRIRYQKRGRLIDFHLCKYRDNTEEGINRAHMITGLIIYR